VNSGRIIFEKKEEHRGWYLVEYSPPMEGCRFASTALVILEAAEKAKIVEAIEAEARIWLARYSIPVMVSAFDDTDSLIHLDSIKPSSHLMAIKEKEKVAPTFLWQEVKDSELPDDALDRNKLTTIYHDIGFKIWTSEDRKRVEKKHREMALTAWVILFVWLVAIPLTVIILGETSVWVARMVLIYSLWMVVVQVLKLTGKWRKSKREEEKEREESERNHHHYHCKRNPQGFLRLKIENFESETRERVRKEAEVLKEKQQQGRQ
jgi:hypothetical protein